MSRTKLVCGGMALALLGSGLQVYAQRRISEDRDLTEVDLAAWDCKDKPEGSAKTPDGVVRNTGKNREPAPLNGLIIPKLDSAAFLRHVGPFDAQTKGKRRQDLTAPQLEQLKKIEQQPVSLTAYLVIAYAGPPESTNCGNVDFHDWHLELFEKPLDHAPGIGDPTPIICEITPRTQGAIFRDGIRLQKLAGFFRRPDMESETLGQKSQRVRITGYPLWDDEHNGAADIGTKIQRVNPGNKFHQPWRSTAWEIHPALKIELADGTAIPPPVSPALAAAAPEGTPAPTVAATAAAAQEVTILEPVKIKVRYGETVLPRGLKLPLVSREGSSVTVKYMGQKLSVPLSSTDLH